MRVAGLFSGIGGLELPFKERGHVTALLCENWEPARQVLQEKFSGVPIAGDIATLRQLPQDVDVVTAGFPCTDLSQAGRTAGIAGRESSLVSHVFRLLQNHDAEFLVLENVRNMLVLERGRAMHVLVGEIERLGFRWAYRLVDSRFTGVPQRRQRVIFVAARQQDPRQVLFADHAAEPNAAEWRRDAFGFYWTEGLRGLGWAQDAVPPLKGGSGLGIPSPPAIWLPGAPLGRRLVTPALEDAEALQGFPRGWTAAATSNGRSGPRWKLVGNAVTVGVARWLVGRLERPGDFAAPSSRMEQCTAWPNAAYGERGKIWRVEASCWPDVQRYSHLTDSLKAEELKPLSHRASAGFYARARKAKLRFAEHFLQDVAEHVRCTAGQPAAQTSAKENAVIAA